MRSRDRWQQSLASFLGPGDLLCLPTVPAPAPRKNALNDEQTSAHYYSRALSLTALAGIAHLPQISLPLAAANGAPVGLSLCAAFGRDAFLAGIVQMLGDARY
jgi:amidase